MKKCFRYLALALLLLAACAAAQAVEGPFVLPLDGGALLVSQQGRQLTQPGQYDRIEPLGGGLFAASSTQNRQSLTWLLDGEGKLALESAFEDLYALDGQLYAVEGDLVGVLDGQLNWKVPCAYTQLVYGGEDGYLALTSDPYDERPDGVYYVDGQGQEKATGIRIQYGLAMFSEGLMPVMDGVSGRMGYLDARGDWAITPQYEYAGEFQNGVAEAALAAGAGFIDKQGNWLLTPKYAAVSRCEGEGKLVLAQEDSGEAVLFSADGFGQIKRFDGTDIYFSADFDADLAVLYLDDCTQLIDAQGNVLIECGLNATFDAWSAQNGRVLVRLGDWGENCVWLYDLEGNRVAGPWQEAWLLGQDGGRTLYAVGAFEVYEAVDVEASFHTYEEVPGTRTVQVVDQDGREVIPARPLEALMMDEGGYLLYEDSKGAGAMDAQGRAICYFSSTK